MPTFKARDLAAAVVSCAMFLWLPLAPAAMAQAPSAAAGVVPLAVTSRGAWSATKNYVLDDLVTARGSTWRARRANIGKVPGSTSPSTAADWELFAAGLNPRGAWQSTKTYHRNELVIRLGATWRAKRTSLNALPGAAPVDWEQFAARGATGPAGPSAVGNGSVGSPAIRFSSSSSTGIFSPEVGKIAMTESGALFLHNIGSFNTALGLTALATNTGDNDTALGYGALASNMAGDNNTAVGRGALSGNVNGDSNTAVGSFALASSTQSSNTAVGASALLKTTSGNGNTGVGLNAIHENVVGVSNTAVGVAALFNATTSRNIGIGNGAGLNPTTPVDSIFIGNAGLAADTTTIKIGTQGTQTSTFIAGIRGVTTGVNNAVAVLVDSAGQLGTVSSSRRYKEDILAMGDMSATLMKLRPVTFRYKTPNADGGKPIQYGLIAEEVAEVLPDLAAFNDKGQPETVKYHLLPSFLLEGYQEQQRTIAAQAEQMAALRADVDNLKMLLARLDQRQAAAQPVTLSRSAEAR